METPLYNPYDDQVTKIITLLNNGNLTYLQYTQLHPRVKRLCQKNHNTYYIGDVSSTNRFFIDLFIVVDGTNKLLDGVNHQYVSRLPTDLHSYYERGYEGVEIIYKPLPVSAEVRTELLHLRQLSLHEIHRFFNTTRTCLLSSSLIPA